MTKNMQTVLASLYPSLSVLSILVAYRPYQTYTYAKWA